MWCTRWFLPLFILPLPTASPFFLIFFLISVILHARPCFYCVVVISALFSSTCFWLPVPASTLLTNPIGEALTFGDAIGANLTQYDEETRLKYAPVVVQLLDRCWCDIGAGSWSSSDDSDSRRGFDVFSPRNVSEWEVASIKVARKEYTEKLRSSVEETNDSDNTGEGALVETIRELEGGSTNEAGASEILNETQSSQESYLWRLWDGIFQSTPSSLNHSSRENFTSEVSIQEESPIDSTTQNDTAAQEPVVEPRKESWFRREYDLRKHGLDIIIDFSWSRGS